jgi:hypothetical protein
VPDSAHTQISDALITYTGDPPPLTFTYDQVLTAGRRERRLRRITIASSATAVAGVAVSIAALALPRLMSTAPPTSYTVAGPSWSTVDPTPYCRTASAPPTGPTVAPTTVVNEKNGYRIRIPTEPADHAAARISCYLAAAVPPLLPGVAFYRDPATPAGTVPLQAYPYRVFDPARPAQTTPPGISASAVVTDEQGVGDIGFGVSPAYETAAAAAANCRGPHCSVRTGPHGETVTVLDVTTDSGYRLINVHVYRGDTIIFASASNGTPAAVALDPSQAVSSDQKKAGRKDLPLSIDQLIELTAVPQLDLFP